MKDMFLTKSNQSNNDDQSGYDDGDNNGTAVVEKTADPKTKKPPMYSVVLLNDDYTPMEFVVSVLEQFFNKDRIQATQVMLEVHTKGKGICAIYPHDIASTKVHQVNAYARQNQHPLLCTMEKAL